MSKKICERKIFISSTIHNLKEERTAVQKRLQQPFNHVRFEAIFSDRPETLNMSGDDLETRVGYNPNLFILNQVKYADYYLLLLDDSYYGEINIRDTKATRKQKEIISITHAEFREAFRHAQPVFAFIDKDTWNRYLITLGGRVSFLNMKNRDCHVYDLIREIRRYRKGLNMTIATYSNVIDLVDKMEHIFNTYDKSKYVFSEFDEEICRSGDNIIAIWEVANEGCIVWKDRFFKEQNTSLRRFIRENVKTLIRSQSDSSLWKRLITFIRKWLQYAGILIRGRKSTAESDCYPIKETCPGERARLTVKYTAPLYGGEIVSTWVMVDSKGKKVYKNLVPLEAEYFVERTDRTGKDDP